MDMTQAGALRSALFLDPGEEDASALRARLELAGVAVLPPPAAGWTSRAILLALRAAGADPMRSWIACPEPTVISAAATAGLAGVVLIGRDPPPGDPGLVVARATGVNDVTRVMVPRGGGCWHDHRPG
jgi:hypothetical protein